MLGLQQIAHGEEAAVFEELQAEAAGGGRRAMGQGRGTTRRGAAMDETADQAAHDKPLLGSATCALPTAGTEKTLSAARAGVRCATTINECLYP